MPAESVLIIDDDPDILDLVRFNLEKEGYRCILADNGPQGLDLIRKSKPSLVVLDIMLPGFSGVEILKAIKSQVEYKGIPIIMLTAKGEEIDRVLGLELGAGDYVTKPFSIRELVLRVKKALERTHRAEETAQPLRCAGIVLDPDRYELRVEDKPVSLTTTEFNLLLFLLRNKGRVVSRETLLDKVWGYHYGGTTRTVDTHIQRLRDKLGSQNHCIETIRGVGYRISSALED
ncbi:MAG: winged helix-turn-helix domain-containing protein [Acidobacteriota bacterium]